MKKRLSCFVIIGVLCWLYVSCSGEKEVIPSSAFAPYISAYTGGTISSGSTVKIEFTRDLPVVVLNTEVKEKLFDFSPAIKGKAYWINSRSIEFVPDSGQLKAGTLYQVDFKLGKVMDVEKKLRNFPFSFRTIEQNFGIELQSVVVSADHPEYATIHGDILFSDQVNLELVKEMFSVEMENKNSLAIKELKPGPAQKTFHFIVEKILRSKEDQTLKVRVNGKKTGIDREVEQSVVIPAIEPFRFVEAKMIYDPESGVEVVFSEPISQAQDLKGLIEIPEASGAVFQVEANIVRIFFETSKLKNVTLKINPGIRSHSGEALQTPASVSLAIESLKPRIELPYSGTILPDSKNLLLPFRAVNIGAVDVKVIRIFEKNILMFMQTNTLNSDNELRRSGRLIYKKTIRLDSDPTRKLDQWNNFSIDLADIIRQEPGAIYRVELSFKMSYSLVVNDGKLSLDLPEKGLSSLDTETLSEEDDQVWDEPSAYYWSGNENMNWSQYNWAEREDPTKPSYYMVQENTKAACNVLASNLGVIVKGNSDKKLWVAVNNILDTQPVSGADLKAYNFQLQTIGSGKTDADGFAVLDVKGKPFILVAESGKEKAYLRLADGEEKSLSRFDVGGKETQKGLKGYVYGERGVWRPGDTLHIGFILEDRIRKIPEDHPVSLEIYNPKGQFYAKQVSTKGTNGFYVFQVPTSPDDVTGLWNAYVKLGGATFHKSLRIETVKPNRLKVNLEIPGSLLDASKENIQASLYSHWLTGATARDLKAAVEMSLSKVKTQFKGYEQYDFNNPASSFYVDKIQLFDGKLNDEGKVNFNINLPTAQNAPGMLQATFISRVFEPGGDVSTFVQSMPFSPYSSYVGINFHQKDDYDFIETDKDQVFDIVTLNGEGKPVNRQDLDYRVYKLGWSWWWESRSESFDSYVNSMSVKPVLSEKIQTKGGKATVKFRVNYPEWGRYLVYIKDKESGHASGKVVYVDWPSWRGRSMKSDPDGITMLSFSTDKKSYEVGEEVTVILPGAAKGKALVALENGSSVLNRAWVTVADSSDTKYTFRVTEEMAPNFYIHVSLLQPHAQTVNDMPIRMYGVIPVLVTNKNSRLMPEINMPASLQPEKEFTVKVREKNGRPMTYTLAIVDDGLLDLTAFKTPDPWNEFYAREALGIKTWDMYDYVIGAFGGKFSSLFSIGGDEALKPSNTKANRFKPVVKFIGPFFIQKGTTGTHKLKLPMYVGSVRTMVVAAQDGAYGNAEKTVTVKNPLMILPTLPRVVSTGEEILLPVNVFAMENTVKDVSVKVETSGLCKLSGEASQSLKFSKIGDEMVYFSLKVGPKTGVEKIKVLASGNGQTASETIEIQVRNPNPPVIMNVDRLIPASGTAEFDYQLLDNSNENWVKMEVSRIPSVDINRRFDYLNSYEHCCTEQLVSKAFPLLYVDQFKEMTEKESQINKENIREAIRQLYGRQLQGGGFTYWPGQLSVNSWISSYAGHFLCEARQKGYDVNESVINKWKIFQRAQAQNWTYEYDNRKTRYVYYMEDLQQAYRLYTLALAGNPESGSMNRMKEMQNLSSQARWRLAAAYALDGKKNAANELIFNVEPVVSSYSLSNDTYGSSYRDEAMILETMVLLDNMTKAFAQAKKVSNNLSSEYYFSTQSTAYALLAMGKLASKTAKGMIEMEWSLNAKAQTPVKTAKAVSQLNIPAEVLSGRIQVKNAGKGDLYVSVTSKSKPVNDTLPSVANNLKLDVSYTDLNSRPINIDRLSQGTDFIASVTVSNISGVAGYTDLALTHIIPSGWEIFNERMMAAEGAETPQQNYTFRDIRDDRVFTYFDLPRSASKTFKIRLQAAYVGKYILPAVQCEAMYDTEAQARTKSSWTEVVK